MSEKSKTMYRVEKFLPPACPKCQYAFKVENTDYNLLLGDIVEGKKVIRTNEGYDIIVCVHCGNFTARLLVEAWQVGDRKRAEEFLREGFVNLKEVTGFGDQMQDFHEIHGALGLSRYTLGQVTSGK